LLSDRMFAVQGFVDSFFKSSSTIFHDCLDLLIM
jgi:hypothetical protein